MDEVTNRPTSLYTVEAIVVPLLERPTPKVSSVRIRPPTQSLDRLLKEIDDDPTALFWG